MEPKTKELPLMPVVEPQTMHTPQPADQTRRLALVQPVPPLAQMAPPTPPPFAASPPAMHAAQPAPQSTPPMLAPVAAPPPFMPQPSPGHAPAPQATPAATKPAARRTLRWPFMLVSWCGGMVAGMLVLVLGLGMFGGARDVAASTGDPTADWDTSITLTDAALTAQMRKGGIAQVQNPTLRIKEDGTIALTGNANLFGRGVPVNATIQPTLTDGQLAMEVVSMQLGGLPLPELLVTQIQGSLAGATQPPAGLGDAQIVRIEASAGKLVLYSKMP